ncbi:MAG TPA: PEGA domain-containing protein [Vicinamibacterales bacterium]|nr:PEGA domain-containing protein [Vicinamibacterales bacterium]
MLHSDDPPEEFDPLTREDPSAFSPPPAFGPFRVLHQIGIGALGPVFRTYEPSRDRLVAVKVFRLDIVPEQAQALADALGRATQASLFHPSIVEPVAAGMEGTLAYRADEYVAAESLDVAMRHYAPAPLDKALPFVTQLAGAIDFARAAGVGHGALHPRDIFVTPDEARATGFGVVEALERVGIRAPVRRPYAAPERIDGAAWSTPADIFSLAAIAFELLTGRRPSGTGDRIGALPEGAHSAALHAVLARAMDDDPSKRFATALGFVSALEAAGRGEGVPAAAPTAAKMAPPPVAVPAPEPPKPAAHAAPVAVPPSPPPPAPPPAAPPPQAEPTAGEFEIEKDLDPVQRALDDRAAAAAPLATSGASGTLFGGHDDRIDVRVRDEEPERGLHESHGEPIAEARFADEFVEEQTAQAESRRPLEAVHETVAPLPIAPQPPMFGAAGAEPEILREDAERSRLRILPVALGVVVGLLMGFGIGHFVGSRSRDAAIVAENTATAPVNPAASGGAATPRQPGQYSEQKVSPPASTAPQGSTAPPSTGALPASPPPVPSAAGGAAVARPAARPPATPAATRGRLVVSSTPNRAGVTLNGDWRGRTPLTLDSLPFGRYVIRVVLPGYEVSRHEVTLHARDAEQEVRARLERPAAPPAAARTPARPAPVPPAGGRAATRPANAFTGSLYVDSRPRGAAVFLDGRNVGQTPLSLPEVPIGAHVVRLELEGKRTWTASTRVVAGETARVTGSLEDRQ